MFYFDKINGQEVLKSSILNEISAFFTTRNTEINNLFPKNIRMISPNQTHSDNVEIVDSKTEYPNTDGLILTGGQDAICLRFADCTPLIIYDCRHNIAAVSHAGWRGTAAKIGIKTIRKMSENFGTKVQDIKVLIGPAISVCCYEVGDDVKQKLLSTVKNTGGLYKNNRVSLKDINARQMEEAGVSQVDIAPYCTCCNNDLFYSYRKENGTQNRHYAIVKL